MKNEPNKSVEQTARAASCLPFESSTGSISSISGRSRAAAHLWRSRQHEKPMKAKKIAFTVLILLCVRAAHTPAHSAELIRRDAKPDDVIKVDKANEMAMNAAMSKAKSEIDGFIDSLISPKPKQKEFAVKKAFLCRGGATTTHEYIWLVQLSYREGRFYGRIGNDPVEVDGVKAGDSVVLEKKDACDWMFIDDGYLMGGYTILALRDQMSAVERQLFEASCPFKMRRQ